MLRRRWPLAIWFLFLARVFFYCAALPLWEGYDEWAHFSVIRRMALRGEALVQRESPVPFDVAKSLDLAPSPWALRDMPPPAATHDAYWRLSAAERSRRELLFRAMPAAWASEDSASGLTAYEALQPPLYGWLMVPVLRAARGVGLADQVLWLRWASALIASLTIPLVFLIGRLVFRSDAVALGCAAVVAVMPEFAIDVARVGNECVAVVLFTILTWMALKAAASGLSYPRAAALGVVFGLGLLAKAYFLAAAPALAILIAYIFWRDRTERLKVLAGASIMAAASLSIAGWWYARNLRITGALSGLSEDAMLRGVSQMAILQRAGEVHWLRAIDAILLSHLWYGGWSGLTVRSWMYHLFYALIVLAAVGLVRAIRQPAIAILAVVYAAFWAGQLYNVLLLFLTKGLSGSMGWYMYAVIAAEATLCVAGLRAVSPPKWKSWVAPIGAALFALLDLYTVHCVAMPYYTGLIAHRYGGSLAAFHLSDLGSIGVSGVLTRLGAYKAGILSAPLLVALWAAYLAATIAAPVIGFIRRQEPGSPPDRDS
jgi:hypothetical protein